MKINIIVLLFLVFLANACGKPFDRHSQTNTYIYENKSGLDCKLTFYNGKSFYKDIDIPNNQIYTEKVILKAPYTYIEDPCIAFSDSVRIVFSDHKTILYRHKDPFNAIYTRYTNRETNGRNRTYTFILSTQDYESAK